MLAARLTSASSFLVAKDSPTEFKRITSPLKYQTRCVAAFPDQQGLLIGSKKGNFLVLVCHNAGDLVDSALKDMAIVMKQLDRFDEAIEAIKSFRHLCLYDS
uniref:Uncharacterized protein n=1 Tax=Quercus lobata TaxID=97700 RepID=A0A7N2LRU1_QUELO